MQMYLASIENKLNLVEKIGHIKYGLISYYYLDKKDDTNLHFLLDHVDKLLIDSGAHSFQHGKKVNFLEFTRQYSEFIKRNTNNPKIEGFFEMDIDNIEGYEKVLEYRAILEAVSDKIIPVWHPNRGVDDFIEMCKKYSGKRIAIGGFNNIDILDHQYNLFLNTAHKYSCKVHILGMTKLDFINKELNLGLEDSFDSNTWLRGGIFGTIFLPKNGVAIKRIYGIQGLREKGLDNSMHKFNLYTFTMVQRNMDKIDRSIEV